MSDFTETEDILKFMMDDHNLSKYADGEEDVLFAILNMDKEMIVFKIRRKADGLFSTGFLLKVLEKF